MADRHTGIDADRVSRLEGTVDLLAKVLLDRAGGRPEPAAD